MEFGEKLQNLRKASNLSQEQLADMLSVSRQSVSKWESGATYPEMDKLIAMAKIFKCSMDDLVNNDVKGKEIVTTKNKEAGGHVDSLLNFVVDTVNMFFSMRFKTLIKTLFEILIIGVVLFGCSIGIIAAILAFLNACELDGGIFSFLLLFLFFAMVLILLAFSLVSFLQIFKVRYLDCYRKALYEDSQIRDLKIDVSNNVEIDEKEKKKLFFRNDKKQIVIVRDSKESNLKFLGSFVEGIRRIAEIFVLFIMFLVILPISFFAIVGLVVGIYLISINSIFIGVVLGIIGVMFVCYEVFEFIYVSLVEKKAPAKRWALMFLIALVFVSIGTGVTIVKLKDFEYISDEENQDIYNVSLDFNDNLIVATNLGGDIRFVIDNNVDDVEVNVEYLEDFYSVSLVDEYAGDKIIKNVRFNYVVYSPSQEIKTFIENLKNNIIFDAYSHNYITVTANEKKVKKMINNLTSVYFASVNKVENGYDVHYENMSKSSDVCKMNDDGINICYRVFNDVNCIVNFNEKENTFESSEGCDCHIYGNEIQCLKNNVGEFLE